MPFDQLRSIAHSWKHRQDSPAGMWERMDDHFAGCLILVEPVLVEPVPSGWQGRLTYLPAGMSKFGWQVGDIKWRSIRKLRWQSYEVEDLHKKIHQESYELLGQHYKPGRMTLVAANEMVVATGGSPTRWRRVGGQPRSG